MLTTSIVLDNQRHYCSPGIRPLRCRETLTAPTAPRSNVAAWLSLSIVQPPDVFVLVAPAPSTLPLPPIPQSLSSTSSTLGPKNLRSLNPPPSSAADAGAATGAEGPCPSFVVAGVALSPLVDFAFLFFFSCTRVHQHLLSSPLLSSLPQHREEKQKRKEKKHPQRDIPPASPTRGGNYRRSRRPRTDSDTATGPAGPRTPSRRTAAGARGPWRRTALSGPACPCSRTTPRSAASPATAGT